MSTEASLELSPTSDSLCHQLSAEQAQYHVVTDVVSVLLLLSITPQYLTRDGPMNSQAMSEIIDITETVTQFEALESQLQTLAHDLPDHWVSDYGIAHHKDECNHWQKQDGRDRLYFRFVGGEDAYLDLTDGNLYDGEVADFAHIEDDGTELRFFRDSTDGAVEIARVTKRRLLLTAADPVELDKRSEDPPRQDISTVSLYNPRTDA